MASSNSPNMGLLAVLFTGWYGFSFLTDMFNKQV